MSRTRFSSTGHRRCFAISCLLATSVLASAASGQQSERTLSDVEWRADIETMVAAYADRHPAPYAKVPRQTFEARRDALLDALPGLGDREIILEMAAIVALARDGHTRLSIPREFPELGIVQGHTGTPPPAHGALRFRALPVVLELFSDGLFVVDAAKPNGELSGLRVVSINGHGVDAAIDAVRPALFAENESAVRFLAPDRLALLDVLAHYGIADDAGRVPFEFEDAAGRRRQVVLGPVDADSGMASATPAAGLPLSRQRPAENRWHAAVPGTAAYYVQIDMTEEFPDVPVIEFMRDALDAARRGGSERLIVDLRDNRGGWGAHNTAIVNSLVRSEFNEYGRLYVLIGRRTFSSAQMLVNALQQYSSVLFVGEMTGSAPDHYGDAAKVVLVNSGLTLRVSTRHWSSWLAGEFRDGTGPHVAAAASGSDYFAGRDPVLDAALAYDAPDGIARQVETLFRDGHVQNGVLRFVGYLSDPAAPTYDVAGEMVDRGLALLDDGLQREAGFMMILARDFLPRSADARYGLGRTSEAQGDHDAARKHYRAALQIDPGHAAARRYLGRLETE